jgi:putative transposase
LKLYFCHSLVNVESAFTKFFREKTGFPNFKSRKNPVQSFQLPQHYTIDFDTNTIKLPKIGDIKAVLHRQFEGEMKNATVSRSSTGKYYISILVTIQIALKGFNIFQNERIIYKIDYFYI